MMPSQADSHEKILACDLPGYTQNVHVLIQDWLKLWVDLAAIRSLLGVLFLSLSCCVSHLWKKRWINFKRERENEEFEETDKGVRGLGSHHTVARVLKEGAIDSLEEMIQETTSYNVT